MHELVFSENCRGNTVRTETYVERLINMKLDGQAAALWATCTRSIVPMCPLLGLTNTERYRNFNRIKDLVFPVEKGG